MRASGVPNSTGHASPTLPNPSGPACFPKHPDRAVQDSSPDPGGGGALGMGLVPVGAAGRRREQGDDLISIFFYIDHTWR